MKKQSLLRCNVISPDPSRGEEFLGLLSLCGRTQPTRVIDTYPDQNSVRRILRFNSPQLLIVDCSDLEKAIPAVAFAIAHAPDLEVVAVCAEDAGVLSRLMRAGVRDYLAYPLCASSSLANLEAILQRIERKPRQPRPGGQVVSFIPAKAGDGASTLAVNTSVGASTIPDSRTLLVDLDLTGSTVRFLLNATNDYLVVDALKSAYELDETMWSRLKGTVGQLDFLAAETLLSQSIETDRVLRLIEFCRNAYDLTCIDLSGTLDPASLEVLRESNRIFLVCTQELASQHLLCRKAALLDTLGLSEEVRVIINRAQPGNIMDASRVEQLVNLKTEITIPNDYKRVRARIEKGVRALSTNRLDDKFTELAHRLMDRPAPKPQGRKFSDILFRSPRISGVLNLF